MKTEAIVLRLNTDLKDKLKVLAKKSRRGFSDYIRILLEDHANAYNASDLDIPPAPVKEVKKTDFPSKAPAGAKGSGSVPGTQKKWKDDPTVKKNNSEVPVSAPTDETGLNQLRSSAPLPQTNVIGRLHKWVTVQSSLEEQQPPAMGTPSVSDWITELRAIEPFDEIRLKDFRARLDACTTLSQKQKTLVK